MRRYVILTLALAWSVRWLYAEPERGDPPPRSHAAAAQEQVGPASENGDAGPSARSRWSTLWQRAPWVEEPLEPPPDRLVSCDLGSSRTFMRESRCIVVGRVEEPRWSILD